MSETAPALALLDELDRLRAAATPDEWKPHPQDDEYVVAGTEDDYVADTGTRRERREISRANAALIVAAVNAAPRLTAAVRAALALADEWERSPVSGLPYDIATGFRAALTAALEEPTDA